MKIISGQTFVIPLIFFFILNVKKASVADTRNVESFLSALMLEEPVDEAKCDRTVLEVGERDAQTVMDTVPRLHGKWVSQECELRPGPKFLLRSYSFLRNNTFKLVRFYYADESCIIPWYTVTAKGFLFLRGGSWATTGATEADYALTKVTIIPQTTEMAEKLFKKANLTCSGGAKKTWRPRKEYVVYRSKDLKDRPRLKFRKTDKDMDCLTALGLEFNELQLIKTQTRPVQEKSNRELFLEDIHSGEESIFSYRPTGFQIPLLKIDQSYRCGNCHVVGKGTERSPPHLMSRPRLPPLPHGRWVSSRCEVRSLGVFLTRRLSFDSTDNSWIGEYNFHSDPSCGVATFSISASGRYSKGVLTNRDLKKRIWSGTDFDFKVDRARITIYDITLKETFAGQKDCGVGPWYVGVPKDVGPTGGCGMLGLIVPTIDYELLKLEIDNEGTPLLFMGLPDTENKRRGYHERPTSYQPPLIQCSTTPLQRQYNSNRVHPLPYVRTIRSLSVSVHQLEFFFIYFSFLRLISLTL